MMLSEEKSDAPPNLAKYTVEMCAALLLFFIPSQNNSMLSG